MATGILKPDDLDTMTYASWHEKELQNMQLLELEKMKRMKAGSLAGHGFGKPSGLYPPSGMWKDDTVPSAVGVKVYQTEHMVLHGEFLEDMAEIMHRCGLSSKEVLEAIETMGEVKRECS